MVAGAAQKGGPTTCKAEEKDAERQVHRIIQLANYIHKSYLHVFL